MLQLLQPISLLAAFGILLPLWIHLWNRRRGKLRKVGSVRLLTESARSHARSLRLTERPLLVLRCLLILVLALLLARPVWREERHAKGWVLLEPGAFRIYTHFRSQVDSLLRAGYQCRAFDSSLAPFSPQDMRADSTAPASPLPYWSVLKIMDEKLPAGLPVYVFSGRALHRFTGSRPTVSLNLHWQTFDTGDSLQAPVALRRTGADSLELATLHSNRGAAYFERTSLRYPAAAKPASDTTLVKDTGLVRVLLYADSPADRQFVSTALEALKKAARLPIMLQALQKENEAAPAGDWLFWLSQKPVPQGLQAAKVFRYAAGKAEEESAWLASPDRNEWPVQVDRIIATEEEPAAFAVWEDSKGRPLLTRSGQAPVTYRFYSRLQPGWTDLPWQPAFAERLFHLLAADRRFTDHRSIDPQQLLPAKSTASKKITGSLVAQTDLQPFAWLASLLLFALERFLSFRKKKKEAYAQ